MADILKYFREVNAQKQINKLTKKYKNKKIVVYGAGLYFQILNDNFDLSKLNIVAISDKKFETNKESNTTKYIPLTPDELKEFNYDVILIALLDDVNVHKYLKYELLMTTQNENAQINSIIEPNLFYIIKTLLGK